MDIKTDNRETEIVKKFFTILNRFYIKVAALQSSYGMKSFFEKNYSNISEKRATFIKEKCEIIKKSKDEFQLKIPVKYSKEWHQLQREGQKAYNSQQEYPRSLFIHLISIFDHFYARLVKCYLSNAMDNILVCGAEKQLTYQEIKGCTSIDDIKEKIFDKEVDILMRKSHTDQLEWLFTRLKGENDIEKALISHFIEITERRNVFVHADGIVSKQYINVCKQNHVKIDDGITEKSQLDITENYFSESIDTLLELATSLVIHTTMTLYKKCDKTSAIAVGYVYTYLQDQRYNVTQNLYKYIMKWKLNNEDQMIADINYILCFYLQNKEEEKVKQYISQMDWSNCSIRFTLAKAVLEKDWKKAAGIMEKMGKTSEVQQDDYLTWPLFEKFRETKEFAETYQKLYGENFSSGSSFETPEAKEPPKKAARKDAKQTPAAKKVTAKKGVAVKKTAVAKRTITIRRSVTARK